VTEGPAAPAAADDPDADHRAADHQLADQQADDRPADDAREPVPADAPSGGGPDPAPDRTP
jgi:hypothetical protein